MESNDRIIIDPDILAGKPILRGTRISVELLLELLAVEFAMKVGH